MGSHITLEAGHYITSAFPPNAGEILPWRMKFKIRQTLGCLNIFLVLADILIYLADKIQNLCATLTGNKFELCLALFGGLTTCNQKDKVNSK